MSHFDTTLVFEAEERGLVMTVDNYAVQIKSVRCRHFWVRIESQSDGLVTDLSRGAHPVDDIAIALRLGLRMAGRPVRAGMIVNGSSLDLIDLHEIAAEVARQERIFLKEIEEQPGRVFVAFD